VPLLCAATVIALHAQTFTTLVKFNGANGANPAYVSLVQGTNGYLYGTTQNGGVDGIGTIFKITPGGKLTTLYSFAWSDGEFAAEGEYPYAGLVQATNGDFYGTTYIGGDNPTGGNYGTVFKVTPSGTLTTLHSFAGVPDGAYPAGLVQAANGNFYGTTQNGGDGNYGSIFTITTAGSLTTQHSFGGTDGMNPFAGLVQATNGNLYGTTQGGGTSDNCLNGCGTVFEITPSGTLTTLYSFGMKGDGGWPIAGLVQASDGYLYGTTQTGGTGGGYGTVFKITPSGKLTTLHSFDSADGQAPLAELVQGTDGNFYGTTSSGGANGYGTIFQIAPSGALTTLHSFDLTDGAYPEGGLVQDTNGDFYGTTSGNSSTGNDDGTVFELSMGLGPFVKTLPTSGRVGAGIKVLGTNLTGATNVTFNGTAAAFAILSPSLITTTVPAGATTGNIQVTTPGGTLLSNVHFQVLP
jgi:uncharacterized repeat protein (TIGR03803 family)